MIFRVDEDCVIGTGSHAGFASDANRFIEIDNAVRTLEHRSCRASGYTWRVGTLVAARYLMRAPDLWKHTNVDVFHVGSGDADRHDILRLAGGRAGMTTDAASVVDDLGPLDGARGSCLWLDHFWFWRGRRNLRGGIYHGMHMPGRIESVLPRERGVLWST
ncbi:MAG: hypothetical protein QOH42_2182 [Blastocatellia bacterium]|nr:hypothetical protein [Blastocatellia bacterium]